MKQTIRTFIAKIHVAKPLCHAIKKRCEELRRWRVHSQLREKQSIIMQGSSEGFENLPLEIEWMLTTFCNFRCSYCFNVRKGYKKNFCTIEQAETAIRHLASANRPSYTVSLLGGEPTTHPHLPEIISLLYKYLGDRLDSLIIISNGSFNEKQMDSILSSEKNINLKLIISVHLEYMNINKVVDLVKRFSNRTYLELRVMFQPDLFEKIVAMTDFLCNLRKDYFFCMEVGLLREGWPTFDKYDHRYTQGHFEWAEKTKKKFDEVVLEGSQWTKANPKTTKGEFLMERNVRGVIESYKRIPESELKELTGCVFTGMTCCAGTNVVRIELDGSVRGILCALDRSSACNIFEENPFIRENWMHDVFCTLPMCGCRVNYPIPKFKSPDDAQKFIAKKRLEQEKLMRECQDNNRQI